MQHLVHSHANVHTVLNESEQLTGASEDMFEDWRAHWKARVTITELTQAIVAYTHYIAGNHQ